jgi:hypothetical protein
MFPLKRQVVLYLLNQLCRIYIPGELLFIMLERHLIAGFRASSKVSAALLFRSSARMQTVVDISV